MFKWIFSKLGYIPKSKLTEAIKNLEQKHEEEYKEWGKIAKLLSANINSPENDAIWHLLETHNIRYSLMPPCKYVKKDDKEIIPYQRPVISTYTEELIHIMISKAVSPRELRYKPEIFLEAFERELKKWCGEKEFRELYHKLIKEI